MEAATLAGAGLVALAGLWYISQSSDPTAVQILPTTQSGKISYTSAASLPRSFNQSEGATFSYEGWFEVNDYTHGFGRQRPVFTHGDCPGLYLDTTSNAIMVVVATYGATESVLISNIPAQKWVHFAIVVTQYTVDIYINGTLRQHHTLSQLPKQTETGTVVGSTDGFDGQIGGLVYYSRALSAIEVSTHAMAMPPPSLVKSPEYGAYFAPSWYTGR
jgi:hypothetical protein